ncbi:replication restart helicase PriA [Helicobacter sp. T3_23-1056]
MNYYLISPFGVKSPPFTYKATHNYAKGTLVEIDLKEKKVLGVVLGVVAKPSFECKEVVGQRGYFDSRQVELAEFVAYYYYVGVGEVYNLMQPHYVNEGNSSLGSLGNGNLSAGSHCIDFADFESSQAREPSSLPKSAKNSTSTTSPTSIDKKNGEDYLSQDSITNAYFSANRDSSSLRASDSERGNPLFNNNKIDCHANADAFARNDEKNSPYPNHQNVAEGATNDKNNPPSLAEGARGRVDSNVESSSQADLQNPCGTSPQLRSSDLSHKREWAQLHKQNPLFDNNKIDCHEFATFDKVANSRNDKIDSTSQNYQNMAEGARWRVKSTLESSPKSSQEINTESSLRASDSERGNLSSCHTAQSEISKQKTQGDISAFSKPKYDKTIIDKTIDCHANADAFARNDGDTCHTEGAQATEVSQSQLKNRDISGLNPQYDKKIIEKTIDCRALDSAESNASNDSAKHILKSNNEVTICHTKIFTPKVSKNPYFFNLNPLSDAQKSALDFVSDKPISLLFGDTGSGKSEIYFHLIASMLNQGKTALFLMPEISLTPQIESRLKSAFGDLVGIWHSKVSQKSKKEILAKLESSELKIIAGARSALFLPLQNLGLIIIDEEHDDAYKSFKNPRYNARDCAMYLAKKCGIQVVLGSATPSLSSYYLAKKGGYLYRLKGVFFENATKQYIFENAPTSLTSNLLAHIKSTIKSKKQAIIFVPTRANFKALLCQECGYGFACPFCSVNMSLHIKKNCLVCHYCGYAQIIPKSCPQCQSPNLTTKRVGTQQIADELQNAFVESKKDGEIFNNIKIGIFDKDHITTSGKLNKTLKEFKNGEINILVGTQMLSKGHDYHNVELAVVLGIDYVLNGGDFRSFERGVALLHQIAGRAGRKSSGKVFIQSLQTQWIKGFLGDYEEFLAWEEKRRSKNYPPFRKLVMIHCANKRQEKAKEQMHEILQILKMQKKIHIIGYGSNAIERIAGKWRFHILLNGEKISDILDALNALQNQTTIRNGKPQKWVKSTQKHSQDSQDKNTHSQKALVIDKRLEVDIDCLDTL